MSDERISTGGCIFLLVAAPLLLALNAATFGYVLMVTWGWFVVPVFPAAPVLAFAEAAGLWYFIGIVRHRATKNDGNEDAADILVRALSEALLAPALLLACAWVVRWVFQ